MKAVVWHGKHDVRVEDVPEPRLLSPRDAIVRVSSSGICGSDIHMYDDMVHGMHKGDVLGHEFMGTVEELGEEVTDLQIGDRVVVPFPIACGRCWFCRESLTALCDNSNPNAGKAEKYYGFSGAGIFGYSHVFGGYPGGQAEYVRVPFADVGPVKVPQELSDEKALLLADILPAAWMAAENGAIRPGDVVAVFGCGPVGQLAIHCARLMGAEKVIALDLIPDRLHLAATWGEAETVNTEDMEGIVDELLRQTGGRGPDVCIDAAGMEAHGHTTTALFDRAKQALHLEGDSPAVLRLAIRACRKGGTISIAGTYGGVVDQIPIGAAYAKGLTVRMGQTHVHRYMRPLMERLLQGKLDPSPIITHRFSLAQAPDGYRLLQRKEDGCIKVILKP
jgi:threonine dehydrogenase-like Zn-dependent dehydrogenase